MTLYIMAMIIIAGLVAIAARLYVIEKRKERVWRREFREAMIRNHGVSHGLAEAAAQAAEYEPHIHPADAAADEYYYMTTGA